MHRLLHVFKRHRYLLRELVLRDIRSRYVGSLAGVLWSVITPLVLLTVYTFVAHVFSWRMKAAGSDSTWLVAASIFAGLLPWIAFQEGVNRSASTFIENANMIRKQRFPLEALPLKTVLAAVIHQLVATALFVLALLFTGHLSWLKLPLFLLLVALQAIMTFGLAQATAALNVFFRDISQTLGVVFLAAFWATPIVYQRSITERWTSDLLGLNPLTHLVEAYRWILVGTRPPSWEGLLYWLAFSLLSLWLGVAVLRRTRADLLDRI